MSIAKPNLFPNYQAAVITDPVKGLRTFPTAEIMESRKRVSYWVEHLKDPAASTPVQVAVVGDYGSGKTHLMLDAAAELLKAAPDGAYILRLIAPEDTPSAWFRMENSSLRKPDRSQADGGPPLNELVSKLLTECAIQVAEGARITAPAAQELRDNPEILPELLDTGKLNPSVLEDAFRAKLQEICGPFVPSDVRMALEGLNVNKTSGIARDWMYGLPLNTDQASTLRVTQSQAGDAELMGIIVAAAALFRHFKRPFALMIDELEHMAAYDRARQEKKNLTWLKRLLEAMAPTWALIYIAGHTVEAWTWEPNLESRLKFTIHMLVLPPEEIVSYVQFVIGRIPEGLKENVAAIQTATGGKMREVLTLCSQLSDETDGFERPLQADQVRARAGVTPKRAIDAVQGLLQEMSFSVQREATLAKTQFDLLVSNNGGAVAVFDFRHTTTQRYPTQEVARFLAKWREVSTQFPKLMFCIVAEGNADPEVTKAAQQTEAPVRYFDTKTPDFLAQVRGTMELVRSNQSAPPAPQDSRSVEVAAQAATIVDKVQVIDQQIVHAAAEDNPKLLEELRKQRVALDEQLAQLRHSTEARDEAFLKRLEQLEKQRKQDFKELEERKTAAEREAPGSREAVLAAAVLPRDELEEAYAEILVEYSADRALRTVLGNPLFLYGLAAIAFGISVYGVLPDVIWPPVFTRMENYYRILLKGLGALMFCAGAFSCTRSLMDLRRFYEHARRLLREVYIRGRSVEDLALADTTLQELLARIGPARGMLLAREELAGRLWFLRSGSESAEAELPAPPPDPASYGAP